MRPCILKCSLILKSLANHYHSISGDYGADIEWASLNPNREGHLRSLKIEPTTNGYRLWAEITEDEDWREGDRE